MIAIFELNFFCYMFICFLYFGTVATIDEMHIKPAQDFLLDRLQRLQRRPISPDVLGIDGKSLHYKMPVNAISSITTRVTGSVMTVGARRMPGNVLNFSNHERALIRQLKLWHLNVLCKVGKVWQISGSMIFILIVLSGCLQGS
jgi:hypothetical protein